MQSSFHFFPLLAETATTHLRAKSVAIGIAMQNALYIILISGALNLLCATPFSVCPLFITTIIQISKFYTLRFPTLSSSISITGPPAFSLLPNPARTQSTTPSLAGSEPGSLETRRRLSKKSGAHRIQTTPAETPGSRGVPPNTGSRRALFFARSHRLAVR